MDNLQSQENLSFEDALSQFKQIVEKLGSGALKLDESITMFERAITLRDICQARLNGARLKISNIIAEEKKAINIMTDEKKINNMG
jgi:exodeoxyribonuclease VII small subunit